MIIPSASNFKLKFPELSGETDASIEFAIEEASRLVDDTWAPKDQTLALQYLTAHYVVVGIARRESATGQRVVSERLADMGMTFETTRPTEDDFSSSLYGHRYKKMLMRNFSGGLVV